MCVRKRPFSALTFLVHGAGAGGGGPTSLTRKRKRKEEEVLHKGKFMAHACGEGPARSRGLWLERVRHARDACAHRARAPHVMGVLAFVKSTLVHPVTGPTSGAGLSGRLV